MWVSNNFKSTEVGGNLEAGVALEIDYQMLAEVHEEERMREAPFVSRITELGDKRKDQDSWSVLRQSQWTRLGPL